MKNRYYYSDGTILNHYDGTKTLHREGAPAIEFTNGSKYWYINGEFHREDGPAIELADGSKEWWLNGKYYAEEEYNRIVPQKELDLDFYL